MTNVTISSINIYSEYKIGPTIYLCAFNKIVNRFRYNNLSDHSNDIDRQKHVGLLQAIVTNLHPGAVANDEDTVLPTQQKTAGRKKAGNRGQLTIQGTMTLLGKRHLPYFLMVQLGMPTAYSLASQF